MIGVGNGGGDAYHALVVDGRIDAGYGAPERLTRKGKGCEFHCLSSFYAWELCLEKVKYQVHGV